MTGKVIEVAVAVFVIVVSTAAGVVVDKDVKVTGGIRDTEGAEKRLIELFDAFVIVVLSTGGHSGTPYFCFIVEINCALTASRCISISFCIFSCSFCCRSNSCCIR